MTSLTSTIETRPARSRWLALGAIVLSTLTLGLDMTILITALPTLSAKLGASTDQLQWISAAYTLALAGLLLPAGVLADRFGRKRLLLIGLAIFGASSVIASQVTSADGLIWMRAVMGVGGAIVLPISLAILPTIFSEAERPRAIAVASVATFLGLPAGPLVAGWILNHYDWGWIFLINAPIVVLGLIGIWFFVPESRDPAAPRLDWLGAILVVIGVTAVVYGTIQQPVYGWGDARVLTGLIGGGIFLVAFTAWELRTTTPLIDLRFFLLPRFTWSTVAFVVVGFAMTGVLFVLAPFLQIVQGNDAQGTGLRLLPMVAGMMVGAGLASRLLRPLGARVMIPVGFTVCAAGLAVLATAAADTGYGLIGGGMAVVGFGVALAMITAVDGILGSLPVANTGAGTALTRMLQNVGASLGVAVMGSVLNGVYRADVAGHLDNLPLKVKDAVEGSVAGAAIVAQKLPPRVGAPLLHSAQAAYAHGMSEILIISAALMVVAAIAIAIFLPSTSRTAAPQAVESGHAEVA